MSVLFLMGGIAPEDVPGLCDRVRLLLERGEIVVVVCDVAGLVDPDAATVDALARLQLTARRLGGEIRLRGPCRELRDLLAFTGLREAVPCGDLPVEPGREPEQREPPRGVQEEGDPADPVA